MPYVNIHLVGNATAEQKAELAEAITDAIVRILGKDRDRTSILIHEMPPENWAVAGRLKSASPGPGRGGAPGADDPGGPGGPDDPVGASGGRG